MSQHDYVLADQAGLAFLSDLNNALAAVVSLNSGATAPATTYAYQYWLDTTAGLLKQRNAANSGWVVRATAAEAFTLSRSSNTILGEGDRSKVLIATGSYTQTFTAAATLGDGWCIDVIVDSGVTLTLDPNSSETIDGATTKVIVGPAQGRVVCTGSAFRTMGFNGVVVDRAYAEYTANADLTTTIPADDTIPQNTEGTQILSVTIPPKTTTNRLRCRVQGAGSMSVTGVITAAIFRNGSADAIAASTHSIESASNIRPIISEVEYVPGTTSTVTISVRVGPNTGTMRLNGSNGARFFGGAFRATLVVEEIAA
jgi:hypothetical protein